MNAPMLSLPSSTLAFGLEPSPLQLLLIVGIILLIFGRRLPEVGKSLGKGIVEFKKGLKDVSDEATITYPQPSQPMQQQNQALPPGQMANPYAQQPPAQYQQPYPQQPQQYQQPMAGPGGGYGPVPPQQPYGQGAPPQGNPQQPQQPGYQQHGYVAPQQHPYAQQPHGQTVSRADHA